MDGSSGSHQHDVVNYSYFLQVELAVLPTSIFRFWKHYHCTSVVISYNLPSTLIHLTIPKDV